MKISQYLEKLEDMTNKKVIVTGGTSGIGLSLVKHLLNKHAKVVVMARGNHTSAISTDVTVNINWVFFFIG